MNKRCSKCGETKMLEAFYSHPLMSSGYVNECKACCRDRFRKSYQANRAERRLAGNEYDRSHRTEANDRSSTYRSRNLQKVKARSDLNHAIEAGVVGRQPCERCGSTANVHGHHSDYSKPLEVHWLCRSCHWGEHCGEVSCRA